MNYNILIVDDSATTRAVIRRTLTMAGVPLENCHQASNGRAALDLLKDRKIDLVLADLHMPEMDGIELTSRILADQATRDIAVVVISAEPNAQRLKELEQRGVRGFIRKPFTAEEIRDVLHRTLGVTHA